MNVAREALVAAFMAGNHEEYVNQLEIVRALLKQLQEQ